MLMKMAGSRSCRRSAFHEDGPDEQNARGPSVEVDVRGTNVENVEGSRNIWHAGSQCALGLGAKLTLRNTIASSTCVTVLNLVGLGQTVWASVGGPKNFGVAGAPLWLVACLTPRNMPFPNICYHAEFGRLVKRLVSVRNYGDHPQKFDPTRPDLQGHSRSLEPIDRLPLTAY